jgi:hypothetical protein
MYGNTEAHHQAALAAVRHASIEQQEDQRCG